MIRLHPLKPCNPRLLIILLIVILEINKIKGAGINKPVIKTFIHQSVSQLTPYHPLITTWSEAWSQCGFETKVLTGLDASRHPNYNEYYTILHNSNIPLASQYQYFRFIAMAVSDSAQDGVGGAWYSSPYLLPICNTLMKSKLSSELPNKGKFTIHDMKHSTLMSASHSEWNQITSYIMSAILPQHHSSLLLAHHLSNLAVVEGSVLHINDEDNILNSGVCSDTKIAIKISMPPTSLISASDYAYANWNKLKTAIQHCPAPKIYTFFELAQGQINHHEPLLNEWKYRWKEAGWDPVVLNMTHAKQHPFFEQFQQELNQASYKTNEYNRMCFYRWMAMSALNTGGWICDYDTFPLFMKTDEGRLQQLPNHGQFTGYSQHVPNLLSASANEWNRLIPLLLQSYVQHEDEFWSDQRAFMEIIQASENQVLHVSDTVTAYTPYKHTLEQQKLRGGSADVIEHPYELKQNNVCDSLRGKKAIHFSHASCDYAGFCKHDRATAIHHWMDEFYKQCY